MEKRNGKKNRKLRNELEKLKAKDVERARIYI